MSEKFKYYRHYKNKPYRYVGVAKHSEDLKDYVIYECLYPNDLATLWIRPKDMFHEVSEFQGKTTPRFTPVPYDIKSFDSISGEVEKFLFPLCETIFKKFDPQSFKNRLNGKNKVKLFCFFIENEAVGFKLGYELDPQKYYSWLGGVVEKYRGLGVAGLLMQAQHDWAKSHGFNVIETKSENRSKEMMILNLKSGFDIVGTEISSEGLLKTLFKKNL